MYLQLGRRWKYKCDAKANAKSAPQYGGTVHLFIGTGHSPYKITIMPFTFGSNSIVIHRGPNSLFIFKSVPFSATTPKLSHPHLRCWINLRITLSFSYCDIDSSPKIPVYTLYSRNTVKSCFWGPSEAEGPQQKLLQEIKSDKKTRFTPIVPY
jgi:hypothetical protein